MQATPLRNHFNQAVKMVDLAKIEIRTMVTEDQTMQANNLQELNYGS